VAQRHQLETALTFAGKGDTLVDEAGQLARSLIHMDEIVIRLEAKA
jgi:hypothetical protein